MHASQERLKNLAAAESSLCVIETTCLVESEPEQRWHWSPPDSGLAALSEVAPDDR